MKICSNCNEEREDNQYYTYWHSTQQKYRTRKICDVCTRQQKKEYKLKRKNKDIIVEAPVPTKYCTHCKKDIPITSFYEGHLKYPGSPCSSCIRKQNEQKRYEKIMENGGSERVSQKPNTYVDEFQKAQTFMVLERLGWIYNDNGVWSKEGVKTADNVWLNIPTEKKTVRRPTGIIVKKKHGVHNYINKIIEQKEAGMTYYDLADIYCCSHTTIRAIVNNYYREKKNG